ncbi:MAG: hypothetical protein AB9842_06625 [Bacteroidales bacterium]
MTRLILSILLILAIKETVAQKQPLIAEKDAVIAQAKHELDAMMSDSQSSLRKYAKENNISGEYIFDITIAERGKVISVYAVGSDADDIRHQNKVKDIIRTLKFNFKMPKKSRYKFQYTFNF